MPDRIYRARRIALELVWRIGCVLRLRALQWWTIDRELRAVEAVALPRRRR